MAFRMTAAVSLFCLGAAGCNLLAPTCLGRQERHVSEARTARVEAGELIVLEWAYDTRGSQNDIEIDWSGRLDGTRIRAYATKADCVNGPNLEGGGSDSCRVLAQGGTGESSGAITLIVTHGRGNPEVLGSPPAMKIWIYGDVAKATIYRLTASSFYGPDC